ncbi:MAG: helix-turn-helix transcriptional regulator [Bacteroidales bacterium]|nr:helix-turn-helix transcriptional regulator [Bacteroidales bacterium]
MKYIRDKIGIKLLGKKIRQLRKQQKISQSQLAFESGIPRNQVVSIELGKINTGVSTIFVISKALNIHPKELLDFDYPLDFQE